MLLLVDPMNPPLLFLAFASGTACVDSLMKLFKAGDPVFYAGTLNRQGTNQEYHLVDERIVGPKPKSLSNAEAAALRRISVSELPEGLRSDATTLAYRYAVPGGVA